MDEPVVIVGGGEIGRRFARAAASLGRAHTVVTRDAHRELLQGPSGRPLIICVREQDLAGVLAQVPPARGSDLVVIQNGFIDELLAPYEGHTRGVLWFTARGSFFKDLLPSPVSGPRRDLLAAFVQAAGGSAEAVQDPDVFKRYALEKAIWSCVVGPPLAVWAMDLSTARHEKMAEVHAIVDEACAVVRAAAGTEISPQRVLATVDGVAPSVGWLRGGTHALAWRNGWIVRKARALGIATPANDAVVTAAEALAAQAR